MPNGREHWVVGCSIKQLSAYYYNPNPKEYNYKIEQIKEINLFVRILEKLKQIITKFKPI